MTTPPAGLSSEQLALYRRDGLLRLPGAVTKADAARMTDSLWSMLEQRCPARPGEPETWRGPAPSGLAQAARAGCFAAFASPAVLAAVDGVLGPGWPRPPHWGVPLATFPDRGAHWDVPHQHWHIDVPASAETPAVARVFVLLAGLAAAAPWRRQVRIFWRSGWRARPSATSRRRRSSRALQLILGLPTCSRAPGMRASNASWSKQPKPTAPHCASSK